MVGTFLGHLEQKIGPYGFLCFSHFKKIFPPILIKHFLCDAQNDKKKLFPDFNFTET